MSLAKRVADEVDDVSSLQKTRIDEVLFFLISTRLPSRLLCPLRRHDRTRDDFPQVHDGRDALLREAMNDPDLTRYSTIILDEAH